MVKRSQRDLNPGKAAEMKKTLNTFRWEVRKWAGEIPLGTTVYVALQSLNDALKAEPGCGFMLLIAALIGVLIGQLMKRL